MFRLYSAVDHVRDQSPRVRPRQKYPVIEKLKQQMIQLGALNAMMSGSGPTVFGIFNDTQKARHAYHRIKAAPIAKQVYLTSIFNNRR